MTTIKTWQERNKERVGYANFPALMQAEIDELRAENTALKEAADFDHSEYKRLRDSLRAELDRLKQQEPVAMVSRVDEYGPCLDWYQHWTGHIGAKLYLAAGAQLATCEYCDGTGDFHSADGEWHGRCTCAIGRDAS